MISSNTTAFGQVSSFLCGTALFQRIWHFGSKMFSFGKLCLEFEKCFINLARTFLSSHYKNGHYSDLLQPKRMLQCSKKRLIIFWKEKNQSFIFVSGGLFQLSYFTKLPVLFHRGRYETILKKILRNWSAQPVLNENMSQLFPKYLS